MGSQAVSIGIQMISTVVLARLLTPESYGLVGMVMVVIAFAALFKDLGLSMATIQRESLTTAQVSVMFWVNVVVGGFLSLLVALAAPLVVWFYGKPELLWMTVALGGNILISSLGAQHSALITRQMRFKALATARLSSAFGGLIISILGALAGWAHWALIAGAIGTSVLQTAMFWCFSSWRPGFPQRNTGARSMIRYGLNLTGFELVNFFSRNLDNILIGRVWGDAALGFYSRAYRLVLFPVSQIRTPLVAVAMPALSRLQDEPLRFRNYYRRLLSILAIACMPISAFVVVASEPLVLTLLGPQWLAVAPLAGWLAVAAFLQPVAGLFGAVLMAKGLANRHFRCGFASALFLTLVFITTIPHGVEILVIGYALSGYVLFLPVFIYASRGTAITLADFCSGVWRPAFASIVSAALLYLLRLKLPNLPPAGELSLLAFAFTAITSACYLALPGGWRTLHELQHHIKSAYITQKDTLK